MPETNTRMQEILVHQEKRLADIQKSLNLDERMYDHLTLISSVYEIPPQARVTIALLMKRQETLIAETIDRKQYAETAIACTKEKTNKKKKMKERALEHNNCFLTKTYEQNINNLHKVQHAIDNHNLHLRNLETAIFYTPGQSSYVIPILLLRREKRLNDLENAYTTEYKLLAAIEQQKEK